MKLSKSYKIATRAVAVTATALFYCVSAGAQMSHTLGEVEVAARRQLKDIGIGKTAVDSAALKDNISLSMADVLGFNSAVYIKSSGRATLATVAFRGTAPSHTAVMWNGMPINSPSLGMTDFSTIPAYFIDRAELLHGASSLARTSGGLGGLVDLATSPADIPDSLSLQYVQGGGSFKTFDEFLRVGYGSRRWKFSTRAVCSTSANDFSFINHDKKLNIYDDDHNIVSQYHPRERNRNGSYADIHLLQQVYFTPQSSDRFGLNLWYTHSNRHIPLTTVDYIDHQAYRNRQIDNGLRAVVSYDRYADRTRLAVKGGVNSLHTYYTRGFDRGDGVIMPLSDTHTTTLSAMLRADFEWTLRHNVSLSAGLVVSNDRVKAVDRSSLIGARYSARRTDIEASLSARWQPIDAWGISALLREQSADLHASPLIPALYTDYMLWRPINMVLKGSVAANYHQPTLNDLYFLPGGNPDLKAEKGFSYDISASASKAAGCVSVTASAGWFDSLIDNWILWLPTNKGFFQARNLRSVRSRGIEAAASLGLRLTRDLNFDVHSSFAWTSSVNRRAFGGEYDKSQGKQLPYIPRFSTSVNAAISWRLWTLQYKWCHYSRRYTMTSNENTLSGSLEPYFMTNISLERRIPTRPADISAKIVINNLFNADYQTIMAHPMPGTNFEIFLSITPKL